MPGSVNMPVSCHDTARRRARSTGLGAGRARGLLSRRKVGCGEFSARAFGGVLAALSSLILLIVAALGLDRTFDSSFSEQKLDFPVVFVLFVCLIGVALMT